jgi:hypothetical protein
MGVPASEVGYTAAMPRREDHEVHKDMRWHWDKKKTINDSHGCQSVYRGRALGTILILIPSVSVTIEIHFNYCLKILATVHCVTDREATTSAAINVYADVTPTRTRISPGHLNITTMCFETKWSIELNKSNGLLFRHKHTGAAGDSKQKPPQ